MSELVILTACGLSNRLKPILSGLRVARLTGRKLRIHWNLAQAVSVAEGPTSLEPDANGYVAIPMPSAWTDLFAQDFGTGSDFLQECCLPPGEHRIPRARSGTLVIQYTWRLLHFDDEPDLDWVDRAAMSPEQRSIASEIAGHLPDIAPTIDLQSRIDDLVDRYQLDRDVVGVHVRSNHPYCMQITRSQFVEATERCLDTQTIRAVFLATDDAETEQLFARRFGSRLSVHPKRTRDRTEPAGIEDALIDMHLLSRTGTLLGSRGSTFSEMAWWLGACKADNHYIGPLQIKRPRRKTSEPEMERDPFGGAFNGQTCRQVAFRELLQAFPFRAIAETGTLTGSTTEFLARESQLPVKSVDLSETHVQFARRRLESIPNVEIRRGDSRQFLLDLVADVEFPKTNVFFYLDAHWNTDLPLRGEVEIILANWDEIAVMIDDFRVPDDRGYGFDAYRDNQALRLEYLAPVLSSTTHIYFPAARSASETGARRGSVVLAKGTSISAVLHGLPSFRAFTARPAS